ncbi:MAG TPA: glycine betaine ABC transporter substrate-binding protein [Opitutales bacterium]|nr:glycine betaine ABC transporter substrate-binding protein [Opitutales bacterium]
MKKIIQTTLALGALALSATASAETIRIAYPNWADGIAMTHLAAAVLDEHLNYEVELTQADPGTIYAAIAGGDQDALLDAWLPYTHEPYWEEYGDRLTDLGPIFSYGVTGLVVPAYMEIESIEEINDIADEINGEIIGIDPGAGIYRNTERAIDEYNLDVSQVASSGPAMTAALSNAIDNEKPIVVTGWKPHWKFGRFDLKVLEDPHSVYPIDALKTVVRKGFQEEFPEVAQFFINFALTESQLLDLMEQIDDSDDSPADVARDWMFDHEALVLSWIPRM